MRTAIQPVRLTGHADGLAQLAWILIDNAAKHARSEVNIRLSSAEEVARLSVVDDGPGVPADHLERIFERFHQADPTRSEGGAGLGLAIARWIAEQHGGHLAARNQDHGGASFDLELPIRRPRTI